MNTDRSGVLTLLPAIHWSQKICFAWFVALVLLPCAAFAKRAAPEKVEPVAHRGVRYVAPNDDGRRAYIEAWDVQTNKKLWDLTVFTNRIDPKLEEDVQWVYIKALKVRDGKLIVTSERGKTYRIDMKTKAVTETQRPNESPQATVAALGICGRSRPGNAKRKRGMG